MSIFTKIIQGEIPSYKVAENDDFIAFLDIRPLQKGHTLVVPKKEVDYIFDHEDDVLKELIVFSKQVAKAIEKVVPADRIGVSVIGLEVPHTHIHLIPIHSIADMNFSGGRPSFTEAEMKETAEAINEVFSAQNAAYTSYNDYLALLLIYTANTSIGLSDAEKEQIKSQVGQKEYDSAKALFDELSEVEVIEKIDELSQIYAVGKNRENVLADVQTIIDADDMEHTAQENVLRLLKKLI